MGMRWIQLVDTLVDTTVDTLSMSYALYRYEQYTNYSECAHTQGYISYSLSLNQTNIAKRWNKKSGFSEVGS